MNMENDRFTATLDVSSASRMGRSRKRKVSAPCGLVVIDQEPLRRTAGAECSAAMARLDGLRKAWNRFEREDKPSFVRWRAREFGPLLSELRDVEARVREYEALVHEVEVEMRRGFYDPQTAYQRVMFRRENPGTAADNVPQSRAQRQAGEEPKL